MREFKKKQQRRRFLYSKPVLIVLFLILLFLLKGTWGVFKKSSQSNDNLEGAQATLSELKIQEKRVKESISHLETESGTEEELRTKYNVAKEGERAIVIVEPEQTQKEVIETKEKKGAWSWLFFWRD